MHDWTLRSVILEWKEARVTLLLESHAGDEAVVATGVADLHVPRIEEWGPSVSVNHATGPLATEDGLQCLEIEMQSGDVIRIVASSLQMPATFDHPNRRIE
jgi:hypothetical protein